MEINIIEHTFYNINHRLAEGRVSVRLAFLNNIYSRQYVAGSRLGLQLSADIAGGEGVPDLDGPLGFRTMFTCFDVLEMRYTSLNMNIMIYEKLTLSPILMKPGLIENVERSKVSGRIVYADIIYSLICICGVKFNF
jgi:hypothetical protein